MQDELDDKEADEEDNDDSDDHVVVAIPDLDEQARLEAEVAATLLAEPAAQPNQHVHVSPEKRDSIETTRLAAAAAAADARFVDSYFYFLFFFILCFGAKTTKYIWQWQH